MLCHCRLSLYTGLPHIVLDTPYIRSPKLGGSTLILGISDPPLWIRNPPTPCSSCRHSLQHSQMHPRDHHSCERRLEEGENDAGNRKERKALKIGRASNR